MPRQNRKRQQSKLTSAVMLRHAFTGRRISVPVQPRPVVYNPWNTLTLVFQLTSGNKGVSQDLVSSQLFTALRFQVGLPADLELGIRVRSAFIWAQQSVQPAALNLGVVFYSVLRYPSVDTPPTSPELAHFEDMAGGLRPCSVGYEWPISQQVVPFSSSDVGINLLSFVLNKGSVPVQMHFSILWRPADTSSVPSGTQLHELCHDFSRL